MSNQDTLKKALPEDENDAKKFRDIEEAIQKAINTESSKSQNAIENRKISSAK